MGELTFFLGLQVKQKKDRIFISHDKYIAEILRKFRLIYKKLASTPIDTKKPLLKDPDGEDVDVHTYRSMIRSLMYLTSSRPDIMFTVYACAYFQVTPKALHLHAVKRTFRYLKGKPHLGLWYLKDSLFDLVAYSDSDYDGASLDRKSTTGGCQFLGCRLISWQCKKQTVVATSSTEAKYVAVTVDVHKCYGFIINWWIMDNTVVYQLTAASVKFQLELEAELNRNIDWDEVIDHVKRKQKEDKSVKRYQALKRKPQTEAQARKNMMVYLKNVVGFKMDYFKGVSYDDICLIFEKHFDSNVAFLQKTKEQMDEEDNRALKRLNESKEENAAKKQKLDEEVEELKRHLQIVPNEEDNVYTEATPLARKFWTTVAVKKVNDVTRLQALVDKKKVIIMEATIRDALRLDDTEGVECLPNEEIFAKLARMSYEKPSTKLTFCKEFFSSQWKFLIQTILQCMNAKRTSWNEFSSFMASAVICLSTGRKFNFSKYIFDSLVRNVDSSTKFYMYPRFLQLMIKKQVGDLSTYTTKYTSPALTQKVFANMRRVGKGFSRVKTSLFEGMLVALEVEEGDADENVEDVNAGVAAEGDVSAANDEVPIAVRMIADMDEDADGRQAESQAEIYKVDLEHANKVLSMQEEETKPAQLQEVVDVVTTAKIITEVVTAASDIITAGVVIRDPEESTTSSTIIYAKTSFKDKGKGILVKEPKPLKKQAQIKQDEDFARELEAKLNKNIDWDEVIDHVQRKQKEDKAMDYFKGMTYDDIRPVFEKHFDSNVAFLQKTKEQMDEEDGKALKRMKESQKDKAAKK
uniref:Uncharacterized protein n=1 Tax=Tanacetum cinerariifolium TaxID=118510 RepID=A0A6L2LBS2_TANCI|nr:hypothetical protein [Tanacetum cinerariifolium]